MASPLNEVDHGLLGIALEVMGLQLTDDQRDVLVMAMGVIVHAHRSEAASDAREAAGLPR